MSESLRTFAEALDVLTKHPGVYEEIAKLADTLEANGVLVKEPLPAEIRGIVTVLLDDLEGQAVFPPRYREASVEHSRVEVCAFNHPHETLERFKAVLLGFGVSNMREYYLALSVHPSFETLTEEIVDWATGQVFEADSTVVVRVLARTNPRETQEGDSPER